MSSRFLLEASKLKNVQTNLEKSDNVALNHISKQEYGHEIGEIHKDLEASRYVIYIPMRYALNRNCQITYS